MRVFLVNPSHVSFGVGCDYAALAVRARGRHAAHDCGDPIIADETLGSL